MQSKEKVVDVPGCDATVTAEAGRSRLQFLNRVDDVQGVFTMNAQRVTSAFSYGETRAGD